MYALHSILGSLDTQCELIDKVILLLLLSVQVEDTPGSWGKTQGN